ncbi:MAG: hypothetical protein M1829_004736 [Trizodia sp. TS-e1964]|nr:MAG: hypothetical protein M1829_004736 [Trizodia sp. TS-e1964]
MGASDSKLVFKKGIFRLSEEQRIPANDVYWTSFWELPETAEDVFSLFSPADIRRTRDSSLPNLETLILAVTSRLSLLRNHPSFPDPEIAPEKDALNCVRVLTRVLPYIYESPQLEGWGEKFFWKARRKPTRKTTAQHSEVLFDESRTEDATSDDPAPEEFEEARPLAEELIDTLIDLLFFSGFTLPKTQPGKNKVQANSSYLPGSQSSLKWAPEMIMLFWEALQCNKRFRAFIIEADRAPEFVKLVLCYAIEYKSDLSKHGIVRMCVFVLQTLSAEPNFGKSLNKKFDGQDSIPAAVKIPGFDGTYTDFLIISINMLITASNGRLSVVYPALLAILNNVAAYIENLGVSASSKLLQLFASMSAPEFLLANDSNHNLLHSLLESINAIIEHKYKQNPHFIFAIMRSKKRFLALRNFTLESGKEEIEAQKLRKKEQPNNTDSTSSSNFGTNEDPRSSPNNYPSTSALGRGSVEENTAFAIGEDEDSDEEVDERPTPSQTSPNPHNSQRTSFSSSVEDAVPLQLRGMSEKARGKMPVGTPTFSRQNSTTSLGSHSMANPPSMSGFCPTTAWVRVT